MSRLESVPRRTKAWQVRVRVTGLTTDERWMVLPVRDDLPISVMGMLSSVRVRKGGGFPK